MILVTALCAATAAADVPDAQREEVDYLLQIIRANTCSMERNGKRYQGEEAYSHVNRKYDYFRDEIRTTEDFIAYSATKSTMSGKYYQVICNNQTPVRSRDWLLRKLKAYRAERG